MTRKTLPACLVVVVLTACTTIDAPVGADSGDESGDDSTGTGEGPPTSTTADPTTDPSTSATTTAGTSPSTTNGDTTSDDPTDADATSDDPSDDTSATTGDESSSEGGSTGVEDMPCTSCVSPPGGEWSAPVRLEITNGADAAPGCGDAWSTLVDELFSDLIAPPAECDCSCGEAEDVECPQQLILHRKANNGLSCGAAAILDSYPITPGCNAIGEADQDTRWDLQVPSPQDGSCEPLPQTAVEPYAFANRYTLCGESAPAEGECGADQTCVAESDAPLCVYALGDLACPGDGFGVKHLVATPNVLDNRECSPCFCSDPEGSCVTPGVALYDFDNSCVPELFNAPIDLPSAGCVTSPAAIFDAYYPNSAIPVPQTSCEPNNPGPVGEATADEVVTLCCNG